VLRLSWSHFIELIRIEDPWKRAFYENECLNGHWSVRQLQRQIGSLLFERTGLSKDKAAVIRRANRQESPAPVVDLIRDPYVLEFTGLAERAEYVESDLEGALLDHLQQFLLELGTGFCFEARQKRIFVVGNKRAALLLSRSEAIFGTLDLASIGAAGQEGTGRSPSKDNALQGISGIGLELDWDFIGTSSSRPIPFALAGSRVPPSRLGRSHDVNLATTL
jgi:predicted nuclease of restriction endonuclease-like (RecB) superfamily